MNPEYQSLLALFAYCFPQAQITLITSKHQHLFNLFIADEGITHCIGFSCAYLPSVTHVADFIEASDLVALIELSPTALRLDIKEEMGTLVSSKGRWPSPAPETCLLVDN